MEHCCFCLFCLVEVVHWHTLLQLFEKDVLSIKVYIYMYLYQFTSAQIASLQRLKKPHQTNSRTTLAFSNLISIQWGKGYTIPSIKVMETKYYAILISVILNAIIPIILWQYDPYMSKGIYMNDRPNLGTKYKNKIDKKQISDQIIIFHQPRFPWNKGEFPSYLPFGVRRSCEVAIIWPDILIGFIGFIRFLLLAHPWNPHITGSYFIP